MKLASIICLTILTLTASILKRGEVYNSKRGKVALSFDLSLGKMSANTDNIYSILDLNAEAVIFNVDIKSFEFDNPLVEQQFKTVYMEADKFPKTTFVGKLTKKIDLNSRQDQEIEVNGILDMHGINIQRKVSAIVSITDTDIRVRSEFLIKASDHGIEIPAALFADGHDQIKVVLDATYAK